MISAALKSSAKNGLRPSHESACDLSANQVQVVLNVENTYLYLTHESKDAVAKKNHLYDKADIKLINNFDVDLYVTLDVEEKVEPSVVIALRISKFLETTFVI